MVAGLMSIFFNKDMSEMFRANPSQLSRMILMDSNGAVIDDSYYGSGALKLSATGSSVSYDRLNEARSSAKLECWTSDEATMDALDPVSLGTIIVKSGIAVGNEEIWADLGIFIAYEWTVVEFSGTWKISLSCVDLSEKIRDNKWSAPFQTGGGTYKEAIEDILVDRGNPAEHTLWLHEYTTENAPDVIYTESDDPWSTIYNLAVSSESEIYFWKNGWLVHQKVPDPAIDPAVYLLGGDEFLTEEGQRTSSSSRREVYNGVIVRGEAPWLLFPISGEYWDDDPASATNREKIGERPLVIGSTIAVDDAHCASIAEAEFRKVAGVSEKVTFRSIRDPYLDVGDIMTIEGSDEGLEIFTLDQLEYPLGSESMEGTIRRKRF